MHSPQEPEPCFHPSRATSWLSGRAPHGTLSNKFWYVWHFWQIHNCLTGRSGVPRAACHSSHCPHTTNRRRGDTHTPLPAILTLQFRRVLSLYLLLVLPLYFLLILPLYLLLVLSLYLLLVLSLYFLLVLSLYYLWYSHSHSPISLRRGVCFAD